MTAPLTVARLPPRRRRRLGLVVLVLLFALFLLLSILVPLAAEWLWFQALGYERVFTTRLVAEAVLGVAGRRARVSVPFSHPPDPPPRPLPQPPVRPGSPGP